MIRFATALEQHLRRKDMPADARTQKDPPPKRVARARTSCWQHLSNPSEMAPVPAC